MTVTRDKFIELVQENNYEALITMRDLSNLNAQDLDFSDSGLDFSSLGLLNLTNANFTNCILPQVDFSLAKLVKANFTNAIAEGANFSQTNAKFINFSGTMLRASNLTDIDAEGADFTGAIVSDAYFMNSFLGGAIFEMATFNEKTVLPDGSNWSASTELERFTDPNHPDFWIDPDWDPVTVEEILQKYKN